MVGRRRGNGGKKAKEWWEEGEGMGGGELADLLRRLVKSAYLCRQIV